MIKRKGSIAIDLVVVKKVGNDYLLTAYDETVEFGLRVTPANASAHAMLARKFKASDRKYNRTFKALNKVVLMAKHDGVHVGSTERWFNTLIYFEENTLAGMILKQAIDAVEAPR